MCFPFYICGCYELTCKTEDKVPNRGKVRCVNCDNFDIPIFIRVVDCVHLCFIPICPLKVDKKPGCGNCKFLFMGNTCSNCRKSGHGQYCCYCGGSMV